ALGILYRAVDNASMSSRSSPVINVFTNCSLISSAMRFSFRRDNTKSSSVGGPLELLMMRTNACTLLRASSALASSKSKNLSPLPNTCCRENIASLLVTHSSRTTREEFFGRAVEPGAAAGRCQCSGGPPACRKAGQLAGRTKCCETAIAPAAADEEEVRDV